MPLIPSVARCANPACDAEFRRLSEGTLRSVFIANPKAWELPEDFKHKVVWLCEKCSASLNLEIDHDHHTVQVQNTGEVRGRRASHQSKPEL